MTSTDLEGIYAVACAAKGFKPNDDQFRVWWKNLGSLERSDLEQAMMVWYSSHTDFPMPAELRISAENMKHERTKVVTEVLQQQQCPKCGGVAQMMRPVGEQFRTWCMPCQNYRKIYPGDMCLTPSQWGFIVQGLDAAYREWVDRGMKPWERVDPQYDREQARQYV